MNKARQLIGNLGIFTLGNLATKLMVFICLPIYTAYMSSTEYALLDLSQTTVMLLVPILTVAVSDGLIRFVMKDESKALQALSVGVKALLLSLVVLILALPIIQMCFKSWSYSILFVLFYIANALTTLLSSYCRAVNEVLIVAIASIVSAIATLLLTLALIMLLHMGLCGYFIASTVGLAAGIACYFAKSAKPLKMAIRTKVEWAYARRLLLFSLPLVPNAVFWSLSLNAGKYALTIIAGLSAAGLYSAASKLPAVLSTLVSIFQQAWNLAVYREFDSSEQNDGFAERVFQVYRFSNVIVATLLIASSPYLAYVLLQGDFYDAWIMMPLLICSMYYSSMSTYYGSIFTAAMETKSLFLTTCVGATFNIVGCVLLVPSMGVWGAVLALIISNYLIYLARRLEVYRKSLVDYHLPMQEPVGYLLVGFALIRTFASNEALVMSLGVLIICCSLFLFKFESKRRMGVK